MELAVVGVALLTAVAAGVVAEIKLPPPAVAEIGRRAVRREAAKHSDVTGGQIEHDAPRGVDRLGRQMVIVAIAWREITLLVIAGKNFRRSIRRLGRIDRDDHRDERL